MRLAGWSWVVLSVACGSSASQPDGTTGAVESSGGDASSSAGPPGDSSSSGTITDGGSSSDTGVSACEIVDADLTTPPSSTLDGMSVVPVGPGVRFELPVDWVSMHADSGNNLHLSREELELVREGAGEWDTEYAEVLALLFDFDDCAAHVGGDGWGADASSYADLQVRVYLVPETPEALVERVMTQAWGEIVPEVAVDDSQAWTQVLLGYDRSYGDYGGHANIDLRLHRFGQATAVLAGMYVDSFFGADTGEFGALVSTACWDSHADECCDPAAP